MSLLENWRDGHVPTRLAAIRALLKHHDRTEVALHALIELARWCHQRQQPPETWVEIVVLATEIAGELPEGGEYQGFLEYCGDLAFPNEAPPAPFVEALALQQKELPLPVLQGVGQWLRDFRPSWALGPYLLGHALERQNKHREAADSFARSARRAHRIGDDTWAAHALLLQGSTLLRSGVAPAEGRHTLGALAWNRLGPRDQLFMALSLSSSSEWTDRVRSLDILMDLHRQISRARPHHRDLRLQDLRHAASRVFENAGLALPELESRRLRELSETLFTGPEKAKWMSYFNARQQLSRVASLPMDQSDDVLALTRKLASVYPERWRPAHSHFEILREAWTGHYGADSAAPAARRRDPRLPVVDRVAELLHLLAPDRHTTLDSFHGALTSLNQALADLTPQGQEAAGRPVALIWPRLLASTASPANPESAVLLAELAFQHTRLAPPPSYGWWDLAAHLLNSNWAAAGDHVAEAALNHNPQRRDPITRFVARSRYEAALDQRDPHRAARWLWAI